MLPFTHRLYTDTYTSKVASSCFYQLRRLRQIRRSSVSRSQPSWCLRPRLDYCNSVLAGLPRCTTEPLQRVLMAARLVLNLRLHEHITPALQRGFCYAGPVLGTVFRTTSPNQWHWFFKPRLKLNYFAEHITASCVSAPGRLVNSAL